MMSAGFEEMPRAPIYKLILVQTLRKVHFNNLHSRVSSLNEFLIKLVGKS